MPDTPSSATSHIQEHGDGFRLLVVDDDSDIRDLLADYLRKHGFVVESAADGTEMRQKLSLGSFDLLVLDIMMPGEDGLSLVSRTARQKQRGRRTGYPGHLSYRSGRSYGSRRRSGTWRGRLCGQTFRAARTAGPHPRRTPPLRKQRHRKGRSPVQGLPI